MTDRRVLGILLVLCSVAAAGCGGSAEGKNENETAGTAVSSDVPGVDFVTIGQTRIETTLDLTGTLVPVRATTIVSEVDGVIESFGMSDRYAGGLTVPEARLALGIGHRVAQDDVLVQLDPTDYELALDTAIANLVVAWRQLEDLVAWKRQEEISQLSAAVTRAVAQWKKAQADLQRVKELWAPDSLGNREDALVTQAEYDSYVMQSEVALADKEQAIAALKLAEAGPTTQQFRLAEAGIMAALAAMDAQAADLKKTTIRAPYDGVITARYIDIGDSVTKMPRVEIMQIIDPRCLFAQVAVPQRYQRLVTLAQCGKLATRNQKPWIKSEGLLGVEGTVDLINELIDPATRTFCVRVTIDNRQGRLKAGGFVHVYLPLASESLAVPIESVTFDEGQPSVFVLRGDQVEKVAVELGIDDSRSYEILSGLKVGDQVAVGDVSRLVAGGTVGTK